jgi:hypothetical protein
VLSNRAPVTHEHTAARYPRLPPRQAAEEAGLPGLAIVWAEHQYNLSRFVPAGEE